MLPSALCGRTCSRSASTRPARQNTRPDATRARSAGYQHATADPLEGGRAAAILGRRNHLVQDSDELDNLGVPMASSDDLPKHLEMIQAIVDRHARTSFLLKGWSVALVTGVFVLALRGEAPAFVLLAALLPALMLWGLDAFYLRQERLFRCLYNRVRKAEPDPADRFSFDTIPCRSEVACWCRTLFSCTVICFHGPVIAAVPLGAWSLSVWGA